MAACEKCWRDASLRVMLLGGSVVDHYNDLLRERVCEPEPFADLTEDAMRAMRDAYEGTPRRRK